MYKKSENLKVSKNEVELIIDKVGLTVEAHKKINQLLFVLIVNFSYQK